MQPQVSIIFFEKGKKDHVPNAIKKHQDEIVYDYHNLNGTVIKISTNDITKRVRYHQKVDSIIHIGENQVTLPHTFY